MPVLLLCGPEKAGKTTLASQLASETSSLMRHWGPVPTLYHFLPHLLSDLTSPRLTIWDRGWPCEYVYNTALTRNHPGMHDPFLYHWAVGRALLTLGHTLQLYGPSSLTLRALRTPDDLPVEPATEQRLYSDYWSSIRLPGLPDLLVSHIYGHPLLSTRDHASTIISALMDDYPRRAASGLVPPLYVGPPDAPIVVLGEARSSHAGPSPLPFTSRLTSLFGRSLGPIALHLGWTNAGDVPPATLSGRTVIACGRIAQQYVKEAANVTELIPVPHPSHAYRWGSGKAAQTPEYVTLRARLQAGGDLYNHLQQKYEKEN